MSRTFRRRNQPRQHTRLFFATDVHGSDPCFRKFLNAASVYEAAAVILGGDMTGKLLVPIVKQLDGSFVYEDSRGRRVSLASTDQLENAKKEIRKLGRYDAVMTYEEHVELDEQPRRASDLFRQVTTRRLREWAALAAERLGAAGVPGYFILGNDDFPELADPLRDQPGITYAEDGICELPGGFELMSYGWSTPTPWDTPRECSEEEIAGSLARLVADLRSPRTAVFNLHCPPFGTNLDQAPKLDGSLRPVAGPGGFQTEPVGSTAVRAIIEAQQPMLGLHGHVHESPGTTYLGETLCINPGSDYADGILRGAIIDISSDGRVANWQMVHG